MSPFLFAAMVAGAGDWAWVAPQHDARFAGAAPRAIALAETAPADVTAEVAPAGTAIWAQLRFGAADSTRATLRLDVAADGSAELWLDADRDRVLEVGEQLARDGDTWRARLAPQWSTADGSMRDGAPRELRFRRGKSGAVLSCAVEGWLEGTIAWRGKTITARRVDGDGNGLLRDPQDELWLDLDGSGRFEPLSERFATLPVVQIDGERWAVRADERGEKLELQVVEGTGKLTLRIASPPTGAAPAAETTALAPFEVESLQVTLAARDGSAFVALGKEPAIELPPGDYRVVGVIVAVHPKGGAGSTRYTFTREFLARDDHWHAVPKGGEVIVDPLGALAFTAAVSSAPGGRHFQVQPQLATSEGLHIVTATAPDALIELLGPDGKQLATATSGFA